MIKNLVTDDLDQIIANGGGVFTFSQPKYGWTVEIAPGFILSIVKGKQPNAFWRWMQFLVLGFRWKRGA